MAMRRSSKQCLVVWSHEDRIAGKGFSPMRHYNLVYKFIPVPQATNVPYAKAVVNKEWKKARDNSSMGFLRTVKSKEEVILEAQGDKRRVACAISKNAEPEPKLQKFFWQSRAQRRHCEVRFRSLRSLH